MPSYSTFYDKDQRHDITQLKAEQSPTERPSPASFASNKKSFIIASITIIASLLAINSITPHTHPSLLNPHADTTSFTESSLTAASSNVYKLEVFGEYSSHPGSQYPFIRAGRVVEPGRESVLQMTWLGKRSIASCDWGVTALFEAGDVYPDSDVYPRNANVDEDSQLCSITAVFPSPGSYLMTLTVTMKDGDEVVITEEFDCYYVRRELHSLSDKDWNRFLDTYVVLMNVDNAEGAQLYGPRYQNLASLAQIHLNTAGTKGWDHIHEGMGLLTQHVALSSEFESSMQAVTPAFSLPYWDYTIDHLKVKEAAELGVDNYGGFGAIIRGPLFADDRFGNVGLDKPNKWHTIEAGRFAFQNVGMNDTAAIHSPYGYMRAPWNLNPSPYITRYHKMCGEKIDSLDSWPSCASHYKLIYGYDTFYEVSFHAGLEPHGPVHTYLGGVGGGCEQWTSEHYPFSELTDSQLKYIKMYTMFLLKELYRYDYIEFPKTCSLDDLTDEDMIRMVNGEKRIHSAKCAFHCQYEDSLDMFQFSNMSSVLKLESRSQEFIDDLADAMFCSESYWPGDHLEAASASEASFWPIHPTLDRVLQYRLLVNPFEDGLGVWWEPGSTKEDTVYCDIGSICEGHHAGDLTYYKTIIKNTNNQFVASYLTNEEILESVNPSTYIAPYIYDHFHWLHCEEEGYKF